MELIIGGVIVAAILTAIGEKHHCKYCGKELASGESEERCPQRFGTYASASARTEPYKKHGCKGCGASWYWYWSDNPDDAYCASCSRR